MTQLTFGGGRLETQFWKFHARNPWVYETLVRLARDYRTKHPTKRAGISMFWEFIRWTKFMDTGSKPRLSNNHRAFYARLIMRNESDLQGLFIVKAQKVQTTFGPDNKGLPDNRHIA